MCMEILIAAGGTGGHILPGIRIGREIMETSGEFTVAFACGRRPIEEQIYRAENLAPWILPIGSPGNPVKRAFDLSRSFFRALSRLIMRRPKAVLAMGGAVCFPILAAAVLLRIPIFLHESNRIPGRVIRMFSPFARKIFLGLGGMEGKNVAVVGTPTKNHDASETDPRLIVCVGGSQGASNLNAAFLEAAKDERFRAHEFVLIAGPGKSTTSDRVTVKEYEADMPGLLSRTLLAVSRSGAGALADFANHRVPSILVPYPHAMDNHQEANAAVYTDAGAALMLNERDMSPSCLADEISRLLSDRSLLASMKAALAQFDTSRSASIIAGEILSVAQSSARRKPYSTPRETST